MKVCFIGHRDIEKTNEVVFLLRETVKTFLINGFTTFLFGSRSKFDELSLNVVSEFKIEYPNIKRIYVRAEYPYINKSYEEYLLKSYEETYFPHKIINAGKYSYVERNFEMIDKSDCCVFYYNEKQNLSKSGTKIAYDYATKKKKKIINLFR